MVLYYCKKCGYKSNQPPVANDNILGPIEICPFCNKFIWVNNEFVEVETDEIIILYPDWTRVEDEDCLYMFGTDSVL